MAEALAPSAASPSGAAGDVTGEAVQIWKHHEDEEGRSYFYNTVTSVSRWELPEDECDWLECDDLKSGKTFWHNAARDISVWENPSERAAGDWMEVLDPGTGRTFFYNSKERRSVWNKPGEQEGAGAARQGGAAYDEEAKGGEELEMQAAPDGEYHGYVMKEGGGSSMFGRKSWKKRFLVLKNGEIGWFKTYKDYVSGEGPLKERWTALRGYRLEEMLSDANGIRLLPISGEEGERVWSLRCEDEGKKKMLMDALLPHVAGKGFVKNLDRQLSGRRFLNDMH